VCARLRGGTHSPPVVLYKGFVMNFTLTLTVNVKAEPPTSSSASDLFKKIQNFPLKLPDDTEVLNEIHSRLQEACQLNQQHGLSHNPSFSITPVGVSLTPDQGYQ